MRLRFAAHNIAARVVALLALGLMLLAQPQPALAESASVQLIVGDTAVRMTGQTSPGAFVSFQDGSQVIGTTVAASDGRYDHIIYALDAGIHHFTIYARDTDNLIGDSAVLDVNLSEHTVTNILTFLPATLRLSGDSLQTGQGLLVTGQTMPGGRVHLRIDQNEPVTVLADNTGRWSLALDTTKLTIGNHLIYGIISDGSGGQSHPTAPRFFAITTAAAAASMPVPTAFKSAAIGSDGPAEPVTPAIPRVLAPQNNSQADLADIAIVGQADPNSQIEVWNNDRLSGSVVTSRNGGWTMPIHLQAGNNIIKARSCSVNSCSQFSASVSVYYTGHDIAADIWLRLNDYRYAITVGSSIDLIATTSGGIKAYSYDIDWGDGSHKVVDGTDFKTTIANRYTKAGTYFGVIKVTDARDATSSVYFSVRVIDGPASASPPIVQWTAGIVAGSTLLLGLFRPRLVLHLIRGSRLVVKRLFS